MSGAAAFDPGPSPDRRTFAEAIAGMLVELGATHAFGLLGGAIAPVYDALGRTALEVVHCRHEGGAAFAAVEASLGTGRPQVVFTTTGPGLISALPGLAAARWEGAHVVVISGATSVSRRGRWAFQETSYETTDATLFGTGRVFDWGALLQEACELDRAVGRLVAGFARPEGFVAHLALPLSLQKAEVESVPRIPALTLSPPGADPAVAARCAEALAREPFAIWVGYGARHAADAIRRLAERSGAAVFSTPRGKGIFPEDHPQYVGVSGIGGHYGVAQWMGANRPRHVLVLGTRLGELASFWDPVMVPSGGFIHVDADPSVPGAAFPAAPTWGVQAEIGVFVDALLERLPERRRAVEIRKASQTQLARAAGGSRPSDARRPVRARVLLAAVQRAVVDASDAIVLAEAGNAFAWASHLLQLREPGRFRTSTGFGSMGHASAGVIGAAIARGKAVALVGDGAMLMMSELHTAVAHGIPAVWVVLNDARYGMTEQGMRALGMEPRGLALPRVDFAAMARSMGAEGIRVEDEIELDAALGAAMLARRPIVVDVAIDPADAIPTAGRNESLAADGAQRRGA